MFFRFVNGGKRTNSKSAMVNEVVFVSKSGAVLDLFLFVAVSWMPGISFWGFSVDLKDESLNLKNLAPEELLLGMASPTNPLFQVALDTIS
jgi:hypothetical protein